MLARRIPCRLAILGRKILLHDMRAREIFDEPADAAASYEPLQAFVDRVVNQYGKFFHIHGPAVNGLQPEADQVVLSFLTIRSAATPRRTAISA